MSEMIERLAAVLARECKARGVILCGEDWYGVPKAMLEAMREPTRAMMLALYVDDYPADQERGKVMQRAQGSDVVPFCTESEIMAGQYQRLIDAALADG